MRLVVYRLFYNNISTIGKLLPMAIFVVAGLFFLKADNFTPMFPNGAGMGTLSATVLTVFYAFTGFENVGVAAGDIENPQKNVAKALIRGRFTSSGEKPCT